VTLDDSSDEEFNYDQVSLQDLSDSDGEEDLDRVVRGVTDSLLHEKGVSFEPATVD
jgi:hypothetical protein